MAFDIYKNSRTGGFSVRENGRVVARATHILANNCQFVVQPAGRARALRTGAKNVHAFVRCSAYRVLDLPSERRKYARRKIHEVFYSPFQRDRFFYLEGSAARLATHATWVLLTGGRVFTVANRPYRRYIPYEPFVSVGLQRNASFIIWPDAPTAAGVTLTVPVAEHFHPLTDE